MNFFTSRAPWSLALARQYRPHLTWRSILSLRSALRAAAAHAPLPFLDLRLRVPPTSLRLRPATADLWTFDDVFCRQIYRAAVEQPVHTMVDVGAHIGLVSLYVRSHFPQVRIVAVEPDPENRALLTRNLSHAMIVPGALWRDDAPVTFAPATPTSGQVVDGAGMPVQGYTMASLIALSGFSTIDLLKIDAEGAERHLFAGDHAWLSRVRSVIIEFHDDARDASRFDQIMGEAGFTIREAGPQVVYAHKAH